MLQGVSWGTPAGLEGPHRAAMSLAWTRTGLQPANSRPNDDSGGRQAPGIGAVDGEHGRCCPSSEQPRNGVGVAANAEPEAPGIGVDGCCKGTLGVPRRAWRAVSEPL